MTTTGGHPLLGHAVHPASMPGTVYWETDARRGHSSTSSATTSCSGRRSCRPPPSSSFALAAAAETGRRPARAGRARDPRGAADQRWCAPAGRARGADRPEPPRPSLRRRRPGWAAAARRGRARPGGGARRRHGGRRHPGPRRPSTARATPTPPPCGDRGLAYGPAFRTVAETWHGDGEALGRLQAAGGPAGRGADRHPRRRACSWRWPPCRRPPRAGPSYPSRPSGSSCTQPLDGDDRWAHATVRAEPGDDHVADVTCSTAPAGQSPTSRGCASIPSGGARRPTTSSTNCAGSGRARADRRRRCGRRPVAGLRHRRRRLRPGRAAAGGGSPLRGRRRRHRRSAASAPTGSSCVPASPRITPGCWPTRSAPTPAPTRVPASSTPGPRPSRRATAWSPPPRSWARPGHWRSCRPSTGGRRRLACGS